MIVVSNFPFKLLYHLQTLGLPSTQSKLFAFFLRLINKKRFLEKHLAGNRFYQFTHPEPGWTVRRSCRVHKYQINGRNVFTLRPLSSHPADKHILYLHGGAYVQGFNRFHWQFLARLVKSTGCTITAPDYPLAPESTYKQSFAMLMTLYKQLATSVLSKDLILMGDSSGGGFALALAQKIREEVIPQPSQIIMLCPWLDISLNNPEINVIAAEDPFLERLSLQQVGKLYAGDLNASHYLLSPINGSLQGLGKISLFIGSKEILLADARKLKAAAEAEGVSMNYFEYQGMVHGWMFLGLPESKKARDQIIKLISDHPLQDGN